MKIRHLPLASILLLACQSPASAADSTATNILRSTTTFAANSNLGAPNGSTPSNVADGTASTAFTFGDTYSGQNPNPGLLGLSGFAAPRGIDSLTFFDYPAFTRRTASQVTIYYSTSNTGGSLLTSSYITLGTFALPTNNQSGYTGGTDASSSSGFDTLSGLGIPAGTQSLLLGFPSSTAGYGTSFTEIQAFAPAGGVPEPGTRATIVLLAVAGAVAARCHSRAKQAGASSRA